MSCTSFVKFLMVVDQEYLKTAAEDFIFSLILDNFQALDWLKAYYWEPQRKAIPNIRKEVKLKLREMASYLNAQQTQNEDPSLTKSKCEYYFFVVVVYS